MSFDTIMPPYNASDPSATFLSSACLDFLFIELVPMAYRVTNELQADAQARSLAVAAAVAGIPGAGPPPRGSMAASVSAARGSSTAAAAAGGASLSEAGRTAGSGSLSGAGSRRVLDDDEEQDAVSFRLDMLGYRVGQGLVERFSRERPPFHDTLDVIKFLCKDLWTLVFRKQVDNLKTNHRGVYVLTDNAFRPFQRMSTETGGQAVVKAQPFLWFPCGIVRGALAALGITATVQAESNELPGAIFQIKTVPTKV
ncbi:bet3 family protein [Grosmannia clavigera kw1407]|uniref:Bet3 family protein n=1 Tax=Grosmannia clavigera (strain kw1407 / UAMH 11150) TaxID=655863 RepID=F0XPM8_GROCL|nr:bet3 family protein [Grosmannia clavigera kw1407]EFX00342.1 bet3 family protein [Grosmannia clavigera kw1407]